MSKEPVTFFDAIEIITDQKSMIINYKNMIKDYKYDLDATRKWAISLEKEIGDLERKKNDELQHLNDEVELYKKEMEEYKRRVLQSTYQILENLDLWTLACYVANMTGNQEFIDKGQEYLKKLLLTFLQKSGGRWPMANEYHSNIERISNTSRDNLLEYLNMSVNSNAHINELRRDAEELFYETYYLPEWV